LEFVEERLKKCLKKNLVAVVVILWRFLKISEVIVIVNKTSFLVELDDCYCCAC